MSRPVETIRIANEIRAKLGKLLDLRGTSSGCVALIRDDHGQAYEIEIRPASLSYHPEFDRFTKGRHAKTKAQRRELVRAFRYKQFWGRP